LEYCKHNLKDYVKDLKGLKNASTKLEKVFKQCCQNAQKMHKCKIMHRNLNPSHILIDANGNPKFTGFGLSK